ncbi:MAG: adenylyltransferase/cytidyltransferase family protein [Patescibacteria group bacterium]
MKTILVFGVFDGLHAGHLDFLQAAAAMGDRLIVSLAQDEIVMQLKGRAPEHSFKRRAAVLKELSAVAEVIPGDAELGAYVGYRALNPDLVAFGYDQRALAQDFKRFQQAVGDETPTFVLKPYQPETYKSSLLRGQK